MLLQEFNYQIKVKPGQGNKNVDYLSRLDEEEATRSMAADFPDEHCLTCLPSRYRTTPLRISESTYKQEGSHLMISSSTGCSS